MAHILIPAHCCKDREGDPGEFKASLVYLQVLDQPGLHSKTVSQKIHKEKLRLKFK